MGGRALSASLKETEDVARRDRASRTAKADSPAIRLLDAMRAGDDPGVLAVCGETTTVSADNMRWSCRGRDEIQDMLEELRRRFPGITFESRSRHVGFGLVIDEARVQDVREDSDEDEGTGVAVVEDVAAPAEVPAVDDVTAKHLSVPAADSHPMWDEPVTEKRNVLEIWRETSPEHLTPTRLNMPVRVTVRHDDLQVHEVSLSFPAALLKRALGMPVDPLEMSLSEVQSAFIAPVGAGFTSYELARPELTVVPPPPPEPERWAPEDDEPPRRRRRWPALVLVLLVALVGGGGWWVSQGQDSNVTANPPSTSPSNAPVTQPSASTSPSQPTASESPKLTHAQPSDSPSRKPNVTLKSDLAFTINSAALSSEAKSRLDEIAQQVRDAGLHGQIYVDGYTDNLGSASSGVKLSKARATAVSEYLGSRLVGVPVTIVIVAHGEKDPIASNATESGREKNRRVTITLPKP
jgi:outer membrane protein OmpA-like peptidoglycan-associated protein